MTLKNGICTQCIRKTGGCCDSVNLALLEEEHLLFKKRFDNGLMPEGHTLEIHDVETKVYIYSSQEDHCMYLSKDLQCSIYDMRPTICRTYPILWQENSDEEELEFFLDCACPLAHRRPLKDFTDWVNTNQDRIDKMGELDFDKSLSQYINLTVLRDEVNSLDLVDFEEK